MKTPPTSKRTESAGTSPARAVRQLDEWAKGFIFGTAFGVVMVIGLMWAISEKL